MKKGILIIFFILILLPKIFAGVQSIGTVTINPSPINLNTGSTKFVNCTATITDNAGWESITTINATIWDTSASTETSTDDNNSHYTNNSCSLEENDTANSRPVTCGFSLQHYSNPSNWTCKIRSYNASGNLASNETNTTVNSLIALDVIEETINFGTLDLGNTSINDINSTLNNIGNVQIDTKLSGNNLSCTSGSFTKERIKYSLIFGTIYNNMTALTGTPTILDTNIAKSTGAISSKLIFWKISTPDLGIGGTCSNTITFTAESG